MDYTEWFCQRLTVLRMQKGVSARDMSLSLGQSESYINKIENRRALPSFTGFIYICEYFGLTPQEFFDDGVVAPRETKELLQEMKKLTPEQTAHILQIVKDLAGNNTGR
ncbi:MAG: helix-turn-helix transcriptional regulator [Ruminococcaceae bacterium]|nr:helix-turn-helix transcriptional regulator [Oscillospiraceae bacterium]